MNIIEPFVHLPEYVVVVCKLCKFAFIANEAETYMRNEHIISLAERRRIKQAVQAIPSIIRNQDELRHFQNAAADYPTHPIYCASQR